MQSPPPPPAAAADDTELVDGWALVRRRWEVDGLLSAQTRLRFTETGQRFTRRLSRQGVTGWEQVGPAHCRGFIDATTSMGALPELTTRHARRTTLRTIFRTLRVLGVCAGDPTLDVVLPARPATRPRPLTEDEVVLCRASSRLGVAGAASLRRAVAWALGEATAVSSEISAVRIRDVDDADAPAWVHLPGTRRHDPRAGELSEWGRLIIRRQLATLTAAGADASTLLCYAGAATPGQHVAQASVCNALAAVLTAAGLGEDPGVRPASLRGWAGRRLYEQGAPITEVARRLGARSLDTAAEDIDLRWRDPDEGLAR